MTKFAALLGLCMFSVANGATLALEARQRTLVASWSAELEAEGKSPIKRVVALLKQMRAELDNEAAQEATMYDKMVCWCQTNEKEKTKAIADAEALDKELSAEIGSRAAKFGEQATEIARLKKQISADKKALAQATGIRENEASKFSATEKDLMQSVVNVKNAIRVLSKHNSASLLQTDSPLMASMRAVLRDLAYKHELMMADSDAFTGKKASFLDTTSTHAMTVQDRSLLEALNAQGASASGALPLDIALKVVQRSINQDAPAAAGAGFLQSGAAPSSGSYAPQSSAIFGIMTTMKEDFEGNLSQEQKEEMQAIEDFKGMSAAKNEQISVAKDKLDEFEGQFADNQKALSDAKENLGLTRDQRSNDVKFLRNLKLTCGDLDRQWAERSKTRGAETKAVSEAISIITDDDNMDHLRKTVTFLQVDLETDAKQRMVRSRVVNSFRKAAEDPAFNTDDLFNAWHSRSAPMLGAAGSPRTQLSTLAVTISLDGFGKIHKAMDKMSADLKVEQAEEVKFKANCDKNFRTTDKQQYRKNEEKEDLEANIEKLSKSMSKLSEDIAAAKQQTAETEVAIKKASQAREGENSEYQTTVADQRATQEILTKAHAKLQEFYKKAALVQTKVHQEPPVKFNSYKTNAGASPVIGLISQIIEDSKALEQEAVAGESKAQADYQTFVADSNTLIAGLNDMVSAKTKANASAKMDSENAKSDLDSTNGEIAGLAKYEADLHSECDFVSKNFAIRQKARLDEMEAIQQAKAILSGSQ